MKILRKIALCVAFIALSSLVFAQEQKVQKVQKANSNSSSSAREETSVEEEYMSDVDGVVILTLAQSDEYDNKLVAMQFLEEAVNNGNTSPDVMKALNQLAGEGINSQSRTNGRLINNFPDIRRRACLALGKIKTDESKNYLVKVALAENEPMVISAAVNSLGEIGINSNDEVVDAISFANRRNQILNPTSSLAFEVVDAYEKLADSTENKKIIIDSLSSIAADYHYASPVRAKALKVLKSLSGTDTSSSSSSKSSKSTSTADAK